MKLHDTRFLLTGASGGIGMALARALVAQGAHVVVTGRTQASAEAVCRTLDVPSRVHPAVLELDAPQMLHQLAVIREQHPTLDGVINCAGVSGFRRAEALDADFTRHVMGVNVISAITVTQALLPALLRRPTAMVVNIGSTFGSIGYPGFGVYCASKFALRGYSESLRRELAGSPVSVVYIAPRATQTAMNSRAVTRMNEALHVHADSPERVALEIVAAMQSNAAQRFIGWPEKLFVRLNAVVSFLVDRALRRQLPTIRQFLEEDSVHAPHRH